jgi:hypothetical protein
LAKFVPVTVKVKALPPIATLLGVRLAIAGAPAAIAPLPFEL